MARRRLAELSPIDEALLLWQEAVGVPWNAQFALTAPAIDPARARAAWNAALQRHPLASCCIVERADGGFDWQQEDGADVGEIVVVDCPDDDALDRLRIEQLEAPLPLDRVPMVRVVIARCIDRALLISTISHVLTDGLGFIRLQRSVGRNYRAEPDPSPTVSLEDARQLLRPVPTTNLTALTKRWTTRLRVAATQVTKRDRIANQGGLPAGGFGFVITTADLSDITQARRRYDTWFDAYAMAALHVTIQRWNDERGAPCGRVGVTQGVNLRPDEWWDDVVVNLAAFASVMTDAADRVDIATALNRVKPQLDPGLRLDQAREIAGAARAVQVLSSHQRTEFLAATSPDYFDTCAISNGGVMADPPRLVDTPGQSVAWVVTPAMPASGLTIATAVVDDQLQFNVSFRRERFDDAGARAFVDAFIATLRAG